MHSAIDADSIMKSVALAIARNQVGANRPVTEILPSEGITQLEYNEMVANPVFTRYLEAYTTELVDSGFSFAAKCRVLAEDLLPDAYKMVRDPDVPAAVRSKVIENLVDWANLKPKKDVAVQTGAGFSINIVFPDKDGNATPPEKVVSTQTAAPQPIIIENEPQQAQIEQKTKKTVDISGIFDDDEDYIYADEELE